MDHNLNRLRHRSSPSSDRFIAAFSPPSTAFSAGDELNEVDVFYTDDEFSEPPKTVPSASISHRRSFLKQERFGILAALPEERRSGEVVVQKPAAPSSPSFARDIPSIPKPHASSEMNKYSQSMPIRLFQQSAPVKIPITARKPRSGEFEEEEGKEEEVVPPHEMVARGSMRSEKTTFSVVEGFGRTLKGRDLRQVRNAVWRQTGFLD